MKKKLMIALAALTVLGTAGTAYSYTCRTTCQWIFNQYQCTETCSAY